MKKLFLILSILMLNSMIFIKVYAEDLSIDIAGANTTYPGSELTFTINLNNIPNNKINSYTFYLNYDNNISFNDYKNLLNNYDVNLIKESDNKLNISGFIKDESINNFSKNIIELSFKVKGNDSSYVIVENFKLTTDSNEIISLTNTKKSIFIESKEKNKLLKEIIINNKKINFDENKKYKITVSKFVDSIDLEAIPTNENSIVTIKGNNNLKSGNNKIIVQVTDKNGNSKNYIINVNRQREIKFFNIIDKYWFLFLIPPFLILLILMYFYIKNRKYLFMLLEQEEVIDYKLNNMKNYSSNNDFLLNYSSNNNIGFVDLEKKE